HARSLGHARRTTAIHAASVDLQQQAFQPIAQDSEPVAALQLRSRQLPGLAQTDNPRDIFRARAARTLVASAVEHGLERSSLANVEGSHALRRVQLMPGNRQYITTDGLHVDRYLARSLHGISMEVN